MMYSITRLDYWVMIYEKTFPWGGGWWNVRWRNDRDWTHSATFTFTKREIPLFQPVVHPVCRVCVRFNYREQLNGLFNAVCGAGNVLLVVESNSPMREPEWTPDALRTPTSLPLEEETSTRHVGTGVASITLSKAFSEDPNQQLFVESNTSAETCKGRETNILISFSPCLII